MFNLLREAIEGNIRSEEDHQLDWLLVALLLKLIYIMNFNETTLKKLMVDENMQVISKVLECAIEYKQSDMIYLSFRIISFFSRFVAVQAHILTLTNVKTLFNSLRDASSLDRKFLLSNLLDMV